MSSQSPCYDATLEYADAVNELADAEKDLRKVEALKTSETTPIHLKLINAIKRVTKAKGIFKEKRHVLEECYRENKTRFILK